MSVSNSTAHLSAALGVPTWIIKPKREHAVLHYWNQLSDETPWYPSIKLFPFKNKWEDTIKRIKDEILKKIK